MKEKKLNDLPETTEVAVSSPGMKMDSHVLVLKILRFCYTKSPLPLIADSLYKQLQILPNKYLSSDKVNYQKIALFLLLLLQNLKK